MTNELPGLMPFLTRQELDEIDRLVTSGWLKIKPKCPTPHPKQRGLVLSNAIRKVVVAGRRGGKTTGMAILASKGLQQGKRVLYAGPTAEQTDRFWYAVRHYYADDVASGQLVKSETKRIIEEPGVDENAPRIKCKTAFNADTLRGDWGNLILLDEYGIMSPDVDNVVLPMLLDRGGVIVYGGTPNRKNHFFKKYAQAIGDATGRWEAWHFTSHDNPFLDAVTLAEIVGDLTEDGYKQEIMAEFLSGEGAVFRNIEACLHSQQTVVGHHRAHHVVMGVDWGKMNDLTALSVVCADCGLELALDRFNQIGYAFQRKRLRALADKWRVSDILAEHNSIGDPIIEQLQLDGLPVRPFDTTAQSKPPLIESLALAFEREEVQWLDNPVATMELEAYEMKPTRSGRMSYSAPEGLHDDTVIARALANWAKQGAQVRQAYVY